MLVLDLLHPTPLVTPAHKTFDADGVGVYVTTQLPTIALPVRTIAPVTEVIVTDAKYVDVDGNPPYPTDDVSNATVSQVPEITPALFCMHSDMDNLVDSIRDRLSCHFERVM